MVTESKVLLLLSGCSKLLFGVTRLSFKIIELLGLVAVAGLFTFALARELSFLLNSEFHGALEVTLFTLETRLFVSTSEKITMSALISLSGSTKIKFTSFGLLAKFVSSFLGFKKFIVKTLNALIGFSVFALLE